MRELPRERNEVLDLLQQVDISQEDTYIFLSEESLEQFKGLFLEWKHRDVFEKRKLLPRNKILLHGLSGNGKTTLAKFLARRFEVPFVQVLHEQILSSYLGETARYLSMVFDQVKGPCLLFFDEIDSFTMKRGGERSHSEYDKALNIMLIKIERMSPDIIFVGATNRRDAMDPAILRRFDMEHEMPAPSDQDKRAFADRHIKYYDISINGELDTILEENESFSDIKRALITFVRKQILKSIHD